MNYELRIKNRDGQSLIESLVALGVLIVGFLGILALLNNSLGLNKVAADNYKASYLAAEGIEVVKNLIDANVIAGCPWNSGFAAGDFEVSYKTKSTVPACPTSSFLQPYNPGDFLYFDPGANLYSYDLNPGSLKTSFLRKITILPSADGEEIGVSSSVSWTTRGGGSFQVNLEDHFLNYH